MSAELMLADQCTAEPWAVLSMERKKSSLKGEGEGEGVALPEPVESARKQPPR